VTGMNKEELKRQILQDRERLLASLPEEKRRELEQQEVYLYKANLCG